MVPFVIIYFIANKLIVCINVPFLAIFLVRGSTQKVSTKVSVTTLS